jgi:hypothetical protein
MSTLRSKDRASLCTFTFADGRRCRTPRSSGHPHFCYDHARKNAQAQATEKLGRDISYFLSGEYLTACDLSLALGRVFAALAHGHIKPKAAATLAYLGQTLLQTIQLAQHEYTNAFSTDSWRDVVHSHVKQNGKYLNPPPPAQAPKPAPVSQAAPLKQPQPTPIATPPLPKPSSAGSTPPPSSHPQTLAPALSPIPYSPDHTTSSPPASPKPPQTSPPGALPVIGSSFK